jgi:hypothetical protein
LTLRIDRAEIPGLFGEQNFMPFDSWVEDIAGDEMRLYTTDLALERARLAFHVPAAFPSPEAACAEAQAQTGKAAELIAATGYYRRNGELTELMKALAAA